jgi:hypothetical protein
LPLQYQVENASSSCRIQSRHPRCTTCATLSVPKHPFQVRVSACQAPQRAGSSDAGEFSSRPGHPDGGVGQESHLPHHQPGGCPARILMTRRNKTRSRPSSLRDTRNGAQTHTLRIALTPAQYLTAPPPQVRVSPRRRGGVPRPTAFRGATMMSMRVTVPALALLAAVVSAGSDAGYGARQCTASNARCAGAAGMEFVAYAPCCDSSKMCVQDPKLGWGRFCVSKPAEYGAGKCYKSGERCMGATGKDVSFLSPGCSAREALGRDVLTEPTCAASLWSTTAVATQVTPARRTRPRAGADSASLAARTATARSATTLGLVAWAQRASRG